MPFKLSFIVPYMQKGACTMSGPNIFLKNYVRQKPTAANPKEDKKEEYKVMEQFALRSSNDKAGNKRRFTEMNSKALGHKGK